jgi:hypothetical protein
VAKHFAQLLYIVHSGVPLVETVLRTLSMADARGGRTSKSVSGTATAGLNAQEAVAFALGD